MRKFISLMLVLALVLLTSGCVNSVAEDVFVKPTTTDSGTTVSYVYKPGTYTGEAKGYNGTIRVEVTVNESQIRSIEIIESNETDYIVEVEPTPQQPSNPTNPQNNPETNPEDNPQQTDNTNQEPSEQPDQNNEENNTGENNGDNQNGENNTPAQTPQTKTIYVRGTMDSVINQILLDQSLNVDADLYTGATVSCQGLLEAIQKALTEASLR